MQENILSAFKKILNCKNELNYRKPNLPLHVLRFYFIFFFKILNPKRDVTFLNPPTSNKKSVIRDLNHGRLIFLKYSQIFGCPKIALNLILPWFCPHNLTIHLPFMVNKWTGKMRNKCYLLGIRLFGKLHYFVPF